MTTNEGILRGMVFGGRWSEWALSYVHLAFGVALMLPGETMTSASYADLGRLGGETAVGLAFGAVGIARVVALIINGWWCRSPHVRMWGATFGFLAFLVLAVSFAASSLTAGALSTAATTYAVLALVDLGNLWRAAEDAAIAERRR